MLHSGQALLDAAAISNVNVLRVAFSVAGLDH